MKFFVMIQQMDCKNHDISGDWTSYHNIHGPFEDDKAVESAITRRMYGQKGDRSFLVFDGQVVNAKPSS